MTKGTHEFAADPRNDDVLINLNGEIVPRDQAKVSVFDSGFMLGDGVWEGLRLHRGRIAQLGAHLSRLYEGAKALDFDIGLSADALERRLYETIEANDMTSTKSGDVHIRLMVTRGVKSTPYQDPRVTISPPTIVIIPEYKTPDPRVAETGIRLFTVHVRRGAPDVQDPGLNSHSKINCITACIQATKAGADEGLMLDPHGFVATCNSTNFFIVRDGAVWTALPKYLMNGITRQTVIRICRDNGIEVRECDFTLAQVYGADEAFVTGTFAGVVPVREVDGRVIGSGERGALTARLQALYADFMDAECSGDDD